ncbi:unnamed protein product [Spirodela intermedia]|uniref:Uncharacterized protein n=1 Tax=Spirodela intermedia TaxID=51605 RepID=A0A7I8J7G6_SPIIN|nr:unnamed protein product [Spirodela intermedia]CAA6666019.1 unnamed protein product [Spirodela intermedia]
MEGGREDRDREREIYCGAGLFGGGGFSSPPSESTIRFQNQWSSQRWNISSMGTCFVSGRRKKMKRLMMTISEAKSRKTPHRRWQSEARKHWAMAAVKKRLTQTTMLCPADLVSRGKISLGTSHPSGPTTTQLLERRDAQCSNDELRAVLPPEEVPERMLHRPRRLAGLLQVLELDVHLLGSPHLLQNSPGFLQPSLLDKAVRGFREEDASDEHDRRRHAGQAQRQPPPPRVDPLREVVYDVGY